MNAKIVHGTAWYVPKLLFFEKGSYEMGEWTIALVVTAVLAGFRTIDTGRSSEYYS